MRHIRTMGAACAGLLAALALTLAGGTAGTTTAAAADDVIASFETAVSTPLAGAHPDASTAFALPLDSPVAPDATGVNLRRTIISLPPGLLGDPNAVPRCSHADFLNGGACPPAAAVGEVSLVVVGAPQPPLPVYNLVPNGDEPARVGFFASVPEEISIQPRSSGDFGLTNVALPLPFLQPGLGLISDVRLTLWGVPHDPAHSAVSGYVPAPDEQLRPFMTNPTRCGEGELTTTLDVDTWEDPGTLHHASASTPRPEDCAGVPFEPALAVRPATPLADTPSGYEVDLTIPQNEDPNGRAASHLRRAVVTLPQGVTLSPSAATRLEACSDAQLARGSDAAPACPAASQIGTTEIVSPILPGPLSGKLFLGAPLPGDPYRIFQVASGFGMQIKLVGDVRADAATGQLTATFDDLPEVPFSRFSLRFKGGSTAPLANPVTCGPQTATSILTPWSGSADRTPSATLAIGPCAAALPFAPRLTAGLASAQAGATSAFSATVTRADGEATLSRIALRLPPGLVGFLSKVPLCASADAAGGRCAEASRIGSTTIAAGPGPAPFVLGGGRVYLTEGYAGAPYGLAIVVPAQAGPFDLGTVVVRAKVDVGRTDAALTIASDPLPTILQGIPLRIRAVTVTIDRPGFMTAPTSCRPGAIGATVGSVERGDASASAPFQVADCQRLRFTPKLTATLVGRGQTAPRRHPGLDVVLTQPAGQANARTVATTLPAAVVADSVALKRTCAPDELARGACPSRSRFGSATAVSPLLRRPLRGPVFLVSQPRALPRLVVLLRGEVALDVSGRVSIVAGRTRTSFVSPDVPLTRFELRLDGGPRGLLTAPRGACRAPLHAQLNATAQNGRRLDRAIAVHAPCAAPRAIALRARR
jgi:hypothetical protein